MSVLVSVIIPVHNGEKYLRQCLDSVAGQTLQKIEIICVNDGSTDSSIDILNDYAARDCRFKIISQEASNAGHARNMGLDQTSGEYLSFLDADDWFELDMLETMMNCAKEHDADVVFCKAATYDQKTGMHSSSSFSLKSRLVPKNEVFSCRSIREDAFQFCRTAAWDKLYKASFIKTEGLRFQEQPRMNDCFFSTMANVRARRMIVCDKFFVHYRVNSGTSITSISPDIAYPCTLNTFKKLQQSMTVEELDFFGKSWKNFVIKNVTCEIQTFTENIAYKYYCMLRECDFGIDLMRDCEAYNSFLFCLYKKYLRRDWTEETFKSAFVEYRKEFSNQKKWPKWKKSLNGLIPLIRSHSFASLWLQLRGLF
ncbi:MAG: glycosyltransferase family 2 protein [Fibrobacteraceae bacterium]|nr:glycosyltransferase family 2 protein [Fibrobacteraceae bacterium]